MENKLTFIKSDFSGGLNRRDDTTKLQPSEYPLLVNARSRYNALEPIYSAVKQTSGLPTDVLFQGVYAAGSIVLVFAGGLAYYKDFSASSSNFTQVVGFTMSETAAYFYVEFVPASSRNFIRKTTGTPNAAVNLGNTISQTPQCAIVQDGTNQPWIINSDGTARISKNYNQWATDAREYVPIGKQMLYHNGILYVVSPDGSQIFRSVTGRPLDFVVAIDNNGAAVADAGAVSFAVDYGAVSCIRPLNTDANAIFVGTSYRSYMVIPSFDTTLYGEPTYNNVPLFTTGPLSQFAFIELLGDSAFITFSGIRSFNAVQQLKREGKNAPFSTEIAPFLDDIIQDTVAAINFDDYALFAVKTIYGDGVMVYDTLTNKWTAMDKLTGISGIKQFAEIKIPGTRRLFFITALGLYEYYGSSSVEQAGWYFGDFTTSQPDIQHKPEVLNLVFSEPLETGVVRARVYTDSKMGGTAYGNIDTPVTPMSLTNRFPFGVSSQDRVRVIRLDIGRERTGYKQGVYVEWAFPATLLSAQLDTITEANTEAQSIQNTSAIIATVLDITVNGATILSANATNESVAAALEVVRTFFHDASITAPTDVLDSSPSESTDGSVTGGGSTVNLVVLPPDTIITITGYDLITANYIQICDMRLLVSSRIQHISSDGTVVDNLYIKLSAADIANLQDHNNCQIVIHGGGGDSDGGDGDSDGGGGGTIVEPPPIIINPPIIVTEPPPITTSTAVGCSVELNINDAMLCPASPDDYYVLSAGAPANPNVTPDGGLLFTKTPDGHYKFISPLVQGNLDRGTTGSISQMNEVFDFASLTKFEVNGKTFCVHGPDTVFPPEPPPLPDCPYRLMNIDFAASDGVSSFVGSVSIPMYEGTCAGTGIVGGDFFGAVATLSIVDREWVLTATGGAPVALAFTSAHGPNLYDGPDGTYTGQSDILDVSAVASH